MPVPLLLVLITVPLVAISMLIQVAYPMGAFSVPPPVPLTLVSQSLVPLYRAPLSVVSRQIQVSMAPLWSLEGGSSGTEGQFSLLPRPQRRDWMTKTAVPGQWQPGQ